MLLPGLLCLRDLRCCHDGALSCVMFCVYIVGRMPALGTYTTSVAVWPLWPLPATRADPGDPGAGTRGPPGPARPAGAGRRGGRRGRVSGVCGRCVARRLPERRHVMRAAELGERDGRV